MKTSLRIGTFVITALLGTAACNTAAHAGGFYLQEQSTTAIGSTFAGAGANATNASIMYYNPAGITHLNGAQATVGASALKAWESNHNGGSTLFGAASGGGSSDDAIPFTVLPNAYAASPIPGTDNRLWAGVGVSVPFGLSTKYDSDWFGRFDSIKSTLTVIDIQPTIAFQPVEWLSLGAGVNVQRAIADLTNAVANGGATTGKSELTGNDWDVGYNLGAMITPVKGTDIGLAYRSGVTHTLKGNIAITGLSAPGGNVDEVGQADLDLPDIYGVSLAQTITPQWKLLGQVNYIHWSRFKAITATSGATTVESIAENYKNTFSYAIGAEYAWNEATTFRFGYQYDETPTRDAYRDTRVPDGNRNNFGVGVSYDICKNLTFDASASYSLMQSTSFNVQRNVLAGTPRAVVKGNRDDTSFAFGSVGLTYRF